MINRHLFAALALCLVPSLSFGQVTNAAPVAPAATAPAASATTTTAPAPAATDTTSSGERPATYTIEQGDTLWSISHKYNTSIRALMKLNGLKKHALLHIGQVIKLPPADSDSSSK